ncbi:MAG: hypothetical protein GTO33_03405, partial [Acidobacteria bacterium]|nr:hypothetical protein [Acidobacteriota bacterium]
MSTKTKNRFVRRVRLAAVLLSCPAWFAPAWAGDAETPDLTELSLEALMNVE